MELTSKETLFDFRLDKRDCLEAMDVIDYAVHPLKNFAKNSTRLINKCSKPDRKEFTKVCLKTGLGFVVTGFIGFFVKLVFIPINQIIMGS